MYIHWRLLCSTCSVGHSEVWDKRYCSGGLILSSFDRWKGWKVALLVSTVLFEAVHLLRYPSMSGIVLVGVIGEFWGWIALKTKNIVGATVAHFLLNFLFAFMFIS